LNSTSPWHLREAAHRVRRGGVIAYPTEAVFGLGCDPADEDAVRRILRLKGRDAAWPGPVTWIVPVRADVPAWLSGGRQTLAVRVTAHPVAADLCRACSCALVSTSANRSGHAPARTALQLRLRLGDAVDYLVPGRVGTQARPTRILDARSGAVIRA
jgi:L-threonylcarbamoyladenylate synthase